MNFPLRKLTILFVAPLLGAPMPALAQAATAPTSSSLSCDQLAAELASNVGSTMANIASQQDLANVGGSLGGIGQTAKNGALGALSSLLPGAAKSVLATGIGVADQIASKKREKAVDDALAKAETLEREQDGNLARLLELRERFEAKCLAQPAE